MYFKELSSELAIYRQPRLTRLLLVLLCSFFLFIGLINVFNSDEAKSLPIWVSGFICWLGWSGSFGGYVCRFDLAKQTLELKSSSLYTIFKRVYKLSDIKGFKAIPRKGYTHDYRLYAVLTDNTHIAFANYKGRGFAVKECIKMAEFVSKPYQINIDTASL
ncbi:hypothetical protein [Pseudoalteromonas sp. SR41-1]|uniref:hypothetical protein n=1 Tax=Pseudoalteromonas sp. SR41-1 TaxID=2760952 RepID=UPI0016011B6C|nr:hypothetical protein [Pseudoalteromonas sp. SR41-1]MBB1280131.1 hypothetical protein [Pseudoalteromonas sp. SR41-1]